MFENMSIEETADELREACQYGASTSDIVEMLNAIILRERETCAKICDGIDCGEYPDGDFAAGLARECAEEIRARSSTELTGLRV